MKSAYSQPEYVPEPIITAETSVKKPVFVEESNSEPQQLQQESLLESSTPREELSKSITSQNEPILKHTPQLEPSSMLKVEPLPKIIIQQEESVMKIVTKQTLDSSVVEDAKEVPKSENITRGANRGRGRGRGKVGRPVGSGKKKIVQQQPQPQSQSSSKSTASVPRKSQKVNYILNKDIYEFQDESDDSHHQTDFGNDVTSDKNVRDKDKDKDSVSDDVNEKPSSGVTMRKSKRIQERNSCSSISSFDEYSDDVRSSKIRRSSRQSVKSTTNNNSKSSQKSDIVSGSISAGCSVTTYTTKSAECRKNDVDEPTTLIDPVTGVLTPMRQKDDGKYVPIVTHPPVGFVRYVLFFEITRQTRNFKMYMPFL